MLLWHVRSRSLDDSRLHTEKGFPDYVITTYQVGIQSDCIFSLCIENRHPPTTISTLPHGTGTIALKFRHRRSTLPSPIILTRDLNSITMPETTYQIYYSSRSKPDGKMWCPDYVAVAAPLENIFNQPNGPRTSLSLYHPIIYSNWCHNRCRNYLRRRPPNMEGFKLYLQTRTTEVNVYSYGCEVRGWKGGWENWRGGYFGCGEDECIYEVVVFGFFKVGVGRMTL